MNQAQQEIIQGLIEKAYIHGLHRDQDPAAMDTGFHPGFEMIIKKDDSIEKVAAGAWLARVHRMKAENPALWSAETTHVCPVIDISGSAAMAKVDVHKGGVPFSTDYLLLYRFQAGWRIVSKIYSVPM